MVKKVNKDEVNKAKTNPASFGGVSYQQRQTKMCAPTNHSYRAMGDTIMGDTIMGDTIMGDTIMGNTICG